MTETEFNFDDALKSLQAGKPLSSKDGVLTPLIKQLAEAALAAELESHIENEEASNRPNNRKNGRSTKTINPPLAALNWRPHDTGRVVLSRN